MQKRMTIDIETLAIYTKKREAVLAGFQLRGRGTQQAACFDLRVAPSITSDILHGRTIDMVKLQRLATWLVDTSPEYMINRLVEESGVDIRLPL